MKKTKRVLKEFIVLCLLLACTIMPQKAYAKDIIKIEGKMKALSNNVSVDKKIELITKYMNCKKQNLNYYSEITVDEKICSAFEYIDNNGNTADYLILIFEDGTIIGYYPTGKYKDVKAKDSDKTIKTEYTIKKDKIEYKDSKGIVRGIVYFQYPQLKGTTDSIKKINKQLKNESSKFLKSENAKAIEESVQLAIQNNIFSNKEEQYVWFWKTSCKVSYNKNNIISFHMKEEWYAGGVYNENHYGFNYNVETGKALKIKDVISGNTKGKILKAAKKYCGSDTNAYNIIKDTKNYKFYFGKGKVYICYGSYELGHGTSSDIISVAGKYK